MKNLTHIDEEKLEDLPQRGKYLKGWEYYDHRGDPFPYRIIPHFLQSRVGQPWDAVVSEFVHKTWVPAKDRVPSKLAESVELDTFMEDGEVWYYDAYGSSWRGKEHKTRIKDVYSDTFYVHPKTRLLCFQMHKVRKYTPRPATFIHLGEWHQICKQDGIWYDVTAERVGKDCHYNPKSPLISYCSARPKIDWENPTPAFQRWENRVVYYWLTTFKKRQLNHDELKKHGLKNEQPWTREQRKKWAEDPNRHY